MRDWLCVCDYWKSIQSKFIVGSPQMGMQPSHLIFITSAALHSSAFVKTGEF